MADTDFITRRRLAVLDAALEATYFYYLDSLRRLGITDVAYAVAPHLMLKFGLTRQRATEVAGAWCAERAVAEVSCG